MQAELVVGVGRDVMELINRNQPVVECFHPEPVHGEAEGRMGADQNLVAAIEKRPDRSDFPAIVWARRVTEVPFRGDGPVGPEAKLAQGLVMEARTDYSLRHHDNSLAEPL